MKHFAGLIVVILSCFVAGQTFAKNVFVATNGTAIPPYDSMATAANDIQVAIDTTVDGDRVIVNDGTYTPSAEIVVSNNITVLGLNGADATTVSGGNSHRCFQLLDPDCEISGFTITKGYSGSNGGGIYCNNQGSTISNCKILRNISNANGGGLYNGVVNNSIIANNTASLNGGGASSNYLNNCTVSQNYAYGKGGGMSYGRAHNCIVWYNEAFDAGDNFYSNYTSTAYSCSPEVVNGVNGCITNIPQISDTQNGNLHLLKTSPCRNTGNNSYSIGSSDLDGHTRITGGTVDMGAYELADNAVDTGSPTHYVSTTGAAVWPYTSWSRAARNIQDAVDVAEPGDTVIVAAGVYNGGGAEEYGLNRLLIDKAITVRSAGGPEVTFIVGADDPISNNGEASIRGVYLTTNVVFSGFTVSNGYTRAGKSGGGIYSAYYSSIITNSIITKNISYNHAGGIMRCIVKNCVITNNAANNGGGGLYRSIVQNSIITDNSATYGGGIYYGTASNSTFYGNSAYKGGGLYYNDAADCTITSNTASYGGGAYHGTIYSSSVSSNLAYLTGGGMTGGTATDSLFSENVSYKNGGGFSGSTANNCIIRGNRANEYGGGLSQATANNSLINANWAYYDGGGAATGTLNNCTIVDNRASRSGGGVSGGDIRNSIIWFNTASSGGDNFNGTSATAVYSCSPDLVARVDGCITNYPQFSDIHNDNFRLLSSSPCRDIGNNTYASSDHDLDGNARIVNSTVDLGAYELVENSTHNGSPIHYVSMTGSAEWPFTNWITAARNIQDAVDVAEAGDTIMVADGVYNSGGASASGLNRLFTGKSVAIKSVNGAEHTVIKGAMGTNKYSEASIRGVYLTANSTLSGFTISGGYGSSGGGVLCESESNTVTDCIITDNSAEDFGGGMRYGTLNGSLVKNNEATLNGGGIDHVTANNCIISNNLAGVDGGGAASGTVNDSLIAKNTAHNSGGGMSSGTANRSAFSGNLSTSYGGGTHAVTANNCLINDNISLSKGGGMSFGYAHNCVVYGNSASDDGGGVYNLAVIKNSIIINNTGPYYKNISTSSDVTYSCSTTPDLTAGVDGCITNDPMFIADGSDFHLQSGSPCIDAGSAGLTDDLDGISRPLDGNNNGIASGDMGAYEFVHPTADSDGDRVSDHDEVIADTDAVDPNDYFYITAISNGSPLTIYFDSSTARNYTLQSCSNLQDNSWTTVPGGDAREGRGNQDSMSDTNQPAKGPYYRVKVER